MMQEKIDEAGIRVQLNVGHRERTVTIPDERVDQVRRFARAVWRGPFSRRTWSELLFFVVSSLLAVPGLALVALMILPGIPLAVTFIGLPFLAACLRGSRGIATGHRRLADRLLGEPIADPQPFTHRSGLFGWLSAALRDRMAWRAVAYSVIKAFLVVGGVWFAVSVWVEALICLTYPVFHGDPGRFGLVGNVLPPGHSPAGTVGFGHGFFIFVSGIALVFLAPWTTRAVVYVDRLLMRTLLGPDPVTARMRSLEEARAQTVDASVATLRQIERNLHDGTQAQLVALAMRLGQVKEKLAQDDNEELEQVRRLVDDAHRGAKEAIVELRDLVRGIHPPALDVGLEGALATLASRSTVPTELTVRLDARPTPAIEAIAYFCVAELLANVAQHARASRAGVTCTLQGPWLRVVVRDDGVGGAQASSRGSSSSGLNGLAERVRAVDGHFHIVSPLGGPTVVTVDLPLHA